MTSVMEVISPKQLHDLYTSGKPLDVIDVRTPAEYREVHVSYARNVPLETLDVQAFRAGRSGSCDPPLFVLCRSGFRAKQACEKFIAAGYCNVIPVEGGTLAAEAAGLPLERGRKTLSLERQMRIVIGLLTRIGAALAWFVHPAFVAIPVITGAGLVFAGVTDVCPLAMVVARMPWNQVRQEGSCCSR